MAAPGKQDFLGLSQSELTAYLTLLERNPINGSQLSRASGIVRANVYDVLRSLCLKGYAVEVDDGLYAPLPPDEFIKRLRHRCETELTALEGRIEAATRTTSYDYVWTISGYREVMNKAAEMIDTARNELYLLLYPEEAVVLNPHLLKAAERGVEVKYVSMGPPPVEFEYQVVHPGTEDIQRLHGGRVFDVVKDKIELLVGLFERGAEDQSPINWARNHWFVQAIREGIRHDFFHYFITEMLDKGRELTEKELRVYDLIKNDGWASNF